MAWFLLVAVVVLLYKLLTTNLDYWKKRNVPYMQPVPLFGNFFNIFRIKIAMAPFLAGVYHQYSSKYVGIFGLHKPYLLLRDLEIIKNVLTKHSDYFPDRTVLMDDRCDSLFSKMLFTIKSPQWKYHRSKMTPAFTVAKTKNMLGLINDVADDLYSYLDANNEDIVDCKELCSKYTTEVIASVAFGIKANSFRIHNAEFREAGRKTFDFTWLTVFRQTSYFLAPMLVKLLKIPFLHPDCSKFFRRVFWEVMNERIESGVKRNDLIDTLLELKSEEHAEDEVKLENDIAVSQAAQFFLAGYETTSTAASFALFELCISPQIQNKLRSEINATIAEHGSITYECIQDMKYLHMIACETLRKYPSVPFLDRMCHRDYAIPENDLVIEKGIPVFIPLLGIHYDETYFPNPQQFDPERFAEKNKNKIHHFAWMPFGEGPRRCIGERLGMLQFKMNLVHILSKYEVLPCEYTPKTIVFGAKCILLSSVKDLLMKFKKIT